MGVEDYFEFEEKLRKEFLENMLLQLDKEVRDSGRERAVRIVNDYEGRDIEALAIIGHALEKGRFEEFAEKLEKHYKDNLQFLHPGSRRLYHFARVERIGEFFEQCYEQLGVKKSQP